MTVAILSGSLRPQGQSGRIARFFAERVAARGHASELLDLAQTPLPLWDEGLWGAEGLKDAWPAVWGPWAQRFSACDSAIVVCPEYHGLVPPNLQNALLLLAEAPKPLAHKPVLIVSVSASINGAYPVAQLRGFGGKNTHILWLPEHLVIRNAAQMLLPEPPAAVAAAVAAADAELRARVEASLDLLTLYAGALAPLQEPARAFVARYPNGM